MQVSQALTRSTLSLVALEATMLPGLGPGGQAELTTRARREIEALPREEFPYIAAAAPHLAGPYEPRRRFEVAWSSCTTGSPRGYRTRRVVQ